MSGEGLAKKRPEKALTEFRPPSGGRNNNGRITMRFRGQGHRRLYRRVDFKRDKIEVPAKVIAFDVLDVESPPPHLKARIRILHNGRAHALSLETSGHRKGRDNPRQRRAAE